jgi:ubiquinone/menaquinone biosynthesis C-methylase UbiE
MQMELSENGTEKVAAYYSDYDEAGRLSKAWGQVEFVRTQNIISRYLKSPPAVVLDVGGAAGRYSCWLAEAGYSVHLVDPVPVHIEQAKAASEAQSQKPIASCTLGDARHLEFEDETADAVLLLGPLYHLVKAPDRERSLLEAKRVLKMGGVLFAAGISRFASAIDGLDSGFFLDPVFQKIIHDDLQTGQHQNPTNTPGYFMDTFFHHPNELKAEVAEAGFAISGLFAVEGISYMMKDFELNWNVESSREFLLKIIAKIETEPCLIGASPHMMCVGLKL